MCARRIQNNVAVISYKLCTIGINLPNFNIRILEMEVFEDCLGEEPSTF